ncbi:hypothetical protein V6x_52280 [Gimesia chilikensis]|uniref:Uncharacterized protein n=2 Tax=Gimesia TaxID=1649453 RepID=A0A6I6AE28_9PLAN|nr:MULTISPECIES: hypothetical protein [Gimesia]QDU05491.1 hypothetical protein V6x_52280 [Gimesia chilikensis]QGQ24683.1 hypothetical protein F1728_19195 [Gimesia benthica]
MKEILIVIVLIMVVNVGVSQINSKILNNVEGKPLADYPVFQIEPSERIKTRILISAERGWLKDTNKVEMYEDLEYESNSASNVYNHRDW